MNQDQAKVIQYDPSYDHVTAVLTQVLHVEPEVAFTLLYQCDYNIDKAIAMYIDDPSVSKTGSTFLEQIKQDVDHFDAMQRKIHPQQGDQEFHIFAEYEDFATNKDRFYQKYQVNPALIKGKKQSKYYHILVKKRQKSTDIIRCMLQKIIENPEKNVPQTRANSSMEAFAVSFTDKVPVLILYTDLSESLNPVLKGLFQDEGKFQTKLEKQLIFYGIYAKDPQDKWLKKHLNYNHFPNSFQMYIVNMLDEIQLLAHIPLQKTPKEITDAIKKAKSESIKRYLDQKYIRIKYKKEQDGMTWKRPKGYKLKEKMAARQRKILSDRKLRIEQEESYKAMEAAMVKKQTSSMKKHKRQKAEYQEELQSKQKKLKKYEDGLQFKIRVPSGSNILLKVPKEERIQYLYDYIECNQHDYGFQAAYAPQFDIFIGLGQGLNLQDMREEFIGDKFAEAAFLVVREV